MWKPERSMLCAAIALSIAVSSTAAFAAKANYQPAEEAAIPADAASKAGTSQSGNSGPASAIGKDLVGSDKFSPETFTPGGKKVYPFTPEQLEDISKFAVIEGEDSWSISAGLSDSYGNSYFAASYDVGASLSAESKESAGTDGDILEAEAHMEANATAFSSTKEVFAIEMEAETEYGEDYGGSVDVRVLGSSIYSKSVGGSLNKNKNWNKTFLNACTTITVGIPVKVCASLAGEVGFNAAMGLTVTGAAAEFEPYGGVDAEASCSVDVLGLAGAGVSGSLTLIEASLPIEAALDLNVEPGASELEWSLDADLEISTLSGTLSVFAYLGWKEWDKEIASWSGTSTTVSLYHDDGSFQLGNTSLIKL